MILLKLLLVLVALAPVVLFMIRLIRSLDSGEARPPLTRLIAHLALFAIVVFLILPAFGQVPAGHRGVVLRFGAVTNQVLDEGLYMVMPFINSVEIMDVQVQASPLSASAASKDLQDVVTVVTPNWHLKTDQVAVIYQSMRREYGVRVIQPAVQEAVKATTARYNAEELITQRTAVRDQIATMLAERLDKFGIALDQFSITEFSFSETFSKAIEAKVTASQEALKAENDLRRIKIEAEQRIAGAEAEARAIQIQVESISKQGGRDYVALKAIEKWNGALPQWTGGGQPIPFIDVAGLSR